MCRAPNRLFLSCSYTIRFGFPIKALRADSATEENKVDNAKCVDGTAGADGAIDTLASTKSAEIANPIGDSILPEEICETDTLAWTPEVPFDNAFTFTESNLKLFKVGSPRARTPVYIPRKISAALSASASL